LTLAKGNTYPMTSAEYNFHKDPEAAYILLETSTPENPIKLIGWEVAKKNIASKVAN